MDGCVIRRRLRVITLLIAVSGETIFGQTMEGGEEAV
jgi:hypothetical protein